MESRTERQRYGVLPVLQRDLRDLEALEEGQLRDPRLNAQPRQQLPVILTCAIGLGVQVLLCIIRVRFWGADPDPDPF